MVELGLDIAIESRTLGPFLSIPDILNVATCCTHLVHFSQQVKVLSIEGKTCNSLRSFFKYLNSHPTHVHARLYLDELWGIEQHVSKEVQTLLLEPPSVCWTPYAVLKSVMWLSQLEKLKHLEVSLDRQSSMEFVRLLQQNALLRLESLAAITNFAADNFWSALTQTPRLALRALSVSGFRLEYVPLSSVKNVRFLWIKRPSRYFRLYRFLEWVLLDLNHVQHLATIDFPLGCRTEMDAWMALFQGGGLSELRYWDTDGCDIKDLLTLKKHLQGRSQTVAPLTVQGIHRLKEEWTCGKHKVVPSRSLRLDQYQTYRCLSVLEQDMKTVWIRPSC